MSVFLVYYVGVATQVAGRDREVLGGDGTVEPPPHQLGGLGSVVSSQVGSLAANAFCFLSSTLCNRLFNICIVCTVMPISVIGLGCFQVSSK